MMDEKKISQKTLNKSFNLWFWGALTCFSQGQMQTLGYLASMLPIIKKLYPDKKKQQENIHAYTASFNTNPMLGSVTIGMTASLEEARANGKGIDGEIINDMRAGSMGPTAGIDDLLIDGTLIPILSGIAFGMSRNGSPIGVILYIIVWSLVVYSGQRSLYFRRYKLGNKAVDILVGTQGKATRKAISIVSGMVIGGALAGWASITTSSKLRDPSGRVLMDLQKQLDNIYPSLLTVIVAFLCWWLMVKEHVSATWTMIILTGVAFLGVLVGFFNPDLLY